MASGDDRCSGFALVCGRYYRTADVLAAVGDAVLRGLGTLPQEATMRQVYRCLSRMKDGAAGTRAMFHRVVAVLRECEPVPPDVVLAAGGADFVLKRP